MAVRQASYAFANAREVQRERLALLAELLDPGTFRLLGALGVRPGMRCLEVGAGAGSVVAWLCERVAPGGSVLATDLDGTVLRELEHPNLEVSEHDLLTDELPERQFDVVHARLLLAWLPDPEEGLRRILAALKPGGLLLVEEMDFISVAPDLRLDPRARAVFSCVIDAHNTILAGSHCFDPHYGRRLAGELAAAGLVNTGCEGRSWIWHGGGAGGRVWQLTLMQLRESIIASGLATTEELDAALALCADPALRFMSQITMAAWGWQPLSPSRN
jgi:SAM-dependent methyltransferase